MLKRRLGKVLHHWNIGTVLVHHAKMEKELEAWAFVVTKERTSPDTMCTPRTNDRMERKRHWKKDSVERDWGVKRIENKLLNTFVFTMYWPYMTQLNAITRSEDDRCKYGKQGHNEQHSVDVPVAYRSVGREVTTHSERQNRPQIRLFSFLSLLVYIYLSWKTRFWWNVDAPFLMFHPKCNSK